MKKTLTLLVIFLLFISNLNTINAQSINDIEENQPPATYFTSWSEYFPDIKSEAAIVIEAETGTILYGKNIHNKLYPASITKILTTLIALENSSLNEVVTFSRDAVFNVDLQSSRIGIDVGEELTMEQSLYGIMLASANEVAYAVAEHVAGDIPSFTTIMNDKAKSLGAKNSNFTNPHGLPDPNHYTTAYDMSLIARDAIQNETFRDITQTRFYTIGPTNIQEETRAFANHHKFIKKDLHYEGAIGGKTGWTTVSKYSLVTYAKRDGMTLISVIMNCPTENDQYIDTANLLDYAFDNFYLYDINNSQIDTNENFKFFSKYKSFFNTSNSPLEVSEGGRIVLSNNISINDTDSKIELIPIDQVKEGPNNIGSIIYSYNGNSLGKTDIIFHNTQASTLLTDSFIDPTKIKLEDNNPTNLDLEEDANDSFMPLIIGVGIGLFVLIIGLLLIYIYNRRQTRDNLTFFD